MASEKKPGQSKVVETITHYDANRKNIPTAEYQSVMEKEDLTPIQVAYERRNPDLDPQLVWRGKDMMDWSDLVVPAPPIYIQEKVHPKVLIDDLKRTSEPNRPSPAQADLFGDFNGIPEGADKTEFYQHDANWTNRMILGDSLQVMASLAEREGLRGKVQCIYFDPPYGIKFNSNFQWSTTSRDVKDGKMDHITREPEQVKAFRDTWRDGIHSYLTYLRDRLIVARDLLNDSGSIFVQIGDENVHRVRAVMDEVFGAENCVTEIAFAKTTGLGSNFLSSRFDFLLWYAKSKDQVKFRRPYANKSLEDGSAETYSWLRNQANEFRTLTRDERESFDFPSEFRLYKPDNITSQGNPFVNLAFEGSNYSFRSKTTAEGLIRLAKAARIHKARNSVQYVRYLNDFGATQISQLWSDTGTGNFTDEKLYVVQTGVKAVQRCILMTSDPGDLVLDPTCGSGTTATVAEQWGRRWITIDTSRVALALARARIMGARYPFYLLADSTEGQRKEAEASGKWTVGSESQGVRKDTFGNIRHGFVYERIPHIKLGKIANNAEIDVIWEQYEKELAPIRQHLSVAMGQPKTLEEWEIPREIPSGLPTNHHALHTTFWQKRIARQKAIDASIAAKADSEFLYDKPYEDKRKVRVAGPFTVESLSPHRTLGVDENDELIDERRPGAAVNQDDDGFVPMILANLRQAGVQMAHKEDKIDLTSLTPWPGEMICAEGRYEENGKERRAGIFIGPEFGTVARMDLVQAAKEAGEADFDVVIACAFNYDAHSSEFNKLGRIPVLKARMNADLHMSEDLKNTGKGNLFVIFGEPDVVVDCGLWLVDSGGRMVMGYERCKKLSGLDSLEEINRLGGSDLPGFRRLFAGGKVRPAVSDSASLRLDSVQHRGGIGEEHDGGISSVSGDRERIAGGGGDATHSREPLGNDARPYVGDLAHRERNSGSNAHQPKEIPEIQTLTATSFPLNLTTTHYAQITINGVDVFQPNTGEVRSDGPDGIACWFVDTDYNGESFFVRHAYFLGANDPYKSLKTTLKAEIDEEAWSTLHSDTSRPFEKPSSGRIAVKVINHLGDEVMKVFKVNS